MKFDCKERKKRQRIQKGNHIYAVKGNWRLDGTIQSKILAMAFAMAAESERGRNLGAQRIAVRAG
jgi:hypothetical protein